MKKILFILFLIIFASFTFAEKIEFDLNIGQNNEINIEGAKVLRGEYSDIEGEGNYTIILYNNKEKVFEEKFFVTFMSTADLIIDEYDYVIKSVIVPKIEFEEIVIKKENEIFRKNIKGLFCNKDKVCNNYENAISCPNDCKMNQIDGVCVKDKDGVCDPDCVIGVDYDCLEINEKEKFEEQSNTNETIGPINEVEQKNWLMELLPIIFGLGILLTIIFILVSIKLVREK